jgi:hypothetical protein
MLEPKQIPQRSLDSIDPSPLGPEKKRLYKYPITLLVPFFPKN